METLLRLDFWSDQIAIALQAWAIIILSLILLPLAFWAAVRITSAKAKKKIRALTAYTDAVESRLQLARELNTSEAEAIAEIRTEVRGLRQLIEANKETAVVEPLIKEVDASAASLAITNTTSRHILTAQELAIGDLNEKQKLKLVARP